MRKRKVAAGKENSERWLITYSDLITLLLIFFVIMYAMSKVDVAKFLALSASLNQALNPSNEIPLQGLGKTALISAANPTSGHQTSMDFKSLSAQEKAQLHDIVKEDQMFSDLFAQLKTYVKVHNLENAVSLDNQQRGIQITLRDVAFFSSGQDVLRTSALTVLDGLVPFLQTVPNHIQVEGFTDNAPINTAQFPSNWELSALRAVNVVRFLAAKGVDPARLDATAYGQYNNLYPNDSAYHMQLNRRVTVVILKSWITSLALSNSPSATPAAPDSSLASLQQPLATNPIKEGQGSSGLQVPHNLFGAAQSGNGQH